MLLQSFLEAVGGRGMGALELIAMDMKARGMYVCRTLSFAGLLSHCHGHGHELAKFSIIIVLHMPLTQC